MNVLRYAGGGAAGGAIGAAIWAAIVYLAHVEIGWVALGIGGLVGLGVRYMADEAQGVAPGVVAALIALLSVQVGKVLAVVLLFNSIDVQIVVDPQDMVVDLARDVVRERTAQKKPMKWPPGVMPAVAHKQADYPPDVWQEATKRWDKLGPAEQQRQTAAKEAAMNMDINDLVAGSRWEAVKGSYSGFDLLWCGLAMLTAFRLGSGAASSS